MYIQVFEKFGCFEGKLINEMRYVTSKCTVEWREFRRN